MITMAAERLVLDAHVIDALMPDLVGHDRRPSAFLVYLYLYRHGRRRRAAGVRASLQQIASDTGLSKSAVQHGLRTLKRRRLVRSRVDIPGGAPVHVVETPWIRTPGRLE